MEPQPTCLIIGAGLAGLFAARTLQAHTCKATLLEKSRGVGGRLASRRLGDMTFDHGAQYLHANTSEFDAHLAAAEQAGVLRRWASAFPDEGGVRHVFPSPVLRGVPSMTGFPKHLAQGLHILLEQRVIAVRINNGAWSAETQAGHVFMAQALVLTAPLPQGLALLDAGGVTLPPETLSTLRAVQYNPRIALLIGLDGPSGLPDTGGLVVNDGPVTWIADNFTKGVSRTPGALTVLAGEDFSEANLAAGDDAIVAELLPAVRRHVSTPVRTVQVHRWRFARPTHCLTSAILEGHTDPPLVFAGDAFGTGDAEAAALSGIAAAAHLHSSFCPRP